MRSGALRRAARLSSRAKTTMLRLFKRAVLAVWMIERAIRLHIRVSRALSISHPGGILLGGNGIISPGRVAVMAGVKLVGRSPDDPEYLRRHAERRVFVFGDNVVIGANSVVIVPADICDNVNSAPDRWRWSTGPSPSLGSTSACPCAR